MEEQSYTSTHLLGHTGPVTGPLYRYLYYTKSAENLNKEALRNFRKKIYVSLKLHQPVGSTHVVYLFIWQFRKSASITEVSLGFYSQKWQDIFSSPKS